MWSTWFSSLWRWKMQSRLHRTRERSPDPSFGQLQIYSNGPWASHTWFCLSSKPWTAFNAFSQLCCSVFRNQASCECYLIICHSTHLCQVWHSVPGQVRLQINFASLPICWWKGDRNVCSASSCSSFEAQCDALPPVQCWSVRSVHNDRRKLVGTPSYNCSYSTCTDCEGMTARTELHCIVQIRSHIKPGSIIDSSDPKKNDRVYNSNRFCWNNVRVH